MDEDILRTQADEGTEPEEEVEEDEILERLRVSVADTYDVQGALGEGGMALVYSARDIKHDRVVAMKVLRPELASSLGSERFLREIQITAKLSHPHILPLYDSGEADGLLYYVMPFVEGESLSDLIDREQQLSIDEAIKIAREVAEALGHAHSYGLIHRDIKPDNVMLSGGHAIVADFGISRAVSQAGGDNLTQTGMAVGTPAYMSPEQAAGDPNLDGRADVYALGCMLYEMLVGQIPFTGPNAQAIMARHTMDQVTPPSIMRQTVPPELEDIIICAMAKVPADRFRTAQEMAEALTAVEKGGTPQVRASTAMRASTMQQRMSTMQRLSTMATEQVVIPRWRRVGVPAIVAVMAAGVGIAGWQLFGRSGGGVRPVEGGLDPRAVAVLYFEDRSADGELGYVADGITENLIQQFATVPELSVVSRNGVATYRDSDLPRDSIARALDVGSLVTGSVEPVGDRLRVTVRLVEGTSGSDFESRTFELPAAQLLAARDSATELVTGFFLRRLGEAVRTRERRAGTASVDAWGLVQRAERARRDAFQLEEDDPEAAYRTYLAADSLLTVAEEADPNWAEPIVLRGWISYDLSYLEHDRPDVVASMRSAVDDATRALNVAPGHSEALHLRGRSGYRLWLLEAGANDEEQERLLDRAQADLEAAVEADPSLANAWYALSNLFYEREDNMSALIAARRAYEADAFLSGQDRNLWQLFETNYDIEQFPDANRWCTEGARRFPGDRRFLRCQLLMMISPWAEPDVDRAWQLLEAIGEATPESERPYVMGRARMLVGGVLARAGLADSARAVLVASRVDRDVDPDQVISSDEAVVRVILGDHDEAIALLKRYVAVHPGHELELDRDLHWWWRALRDHPEFRSVAR